MTTPLRTNFPTGGWYPPDAVATNTRVNENTAAIAALSDEILEYANLAAFPTTGTVGKIYLALDTNKLYRWSTSVYAEVSPSAGGGSGSTDAEVVRDTIAAALVGTGNITVTPNDVADTITISTAATLNSSDSALRDRSTHTGTQSADTLTDGATNKAFLATERTKLAGIATGATANAADASLRDRATHTGTQTSSSISDFTEAVQDAVGAFLGGGSNVVVTYDDAANTLTVSSTGGGTGGLDAETVRDVIGAAIIGVGNISVAYNDALDTITVSTAATANDTDANLKNRANHTGTQAQSTVTNLVSDLAAKAPLASPAFTGTPTGITKAHVGLGNVDNTSDANKPVSTAQAAANAAVAAASVAQALVDAKGDLLVGSANDTVIRKAVGADGTYLRADAASPGGVTWAAVAGGGASPFFANVLDYGATGNGSTDDRAAFIAARAKGPVFVPSHKPDGTAVSFKISAALPDDGTPMYFGAGKFSSVVILAAGAWFLDNATTPFYSLDVHGIQFNGGAGAIRNRFQGEQVYAFKQITNCYFINYTKAAVTTVDSTPSGGTTAPTRSDTPYWMLDNSIFEGANETTCMGVALGGWTDSSHITACDFRRNKVHLKVAQGQSTLIDSKTSFLHLGRTDMSALYDVHVVPSAVDWAATGIGLTFHNARFGNEGLTSADYRIVIADELTGTNFEDRLPDMSTVSTGWHRGLTVKDCDVFLVGTGSKPLVYSTTPNLRMYQIGFVRYAGGTSPTIPKLLQLKNATGFAHTNGYVGPVLEGSTDVGSQPDLVGGDTGTLAGQPRSMVTIATGGGGGTAAGSYTQTIGDGATTTFTITHNLGTRANVVSVYDATTYAEVSVAPVVHTSVNSVTITFASAPATSSRIVTVVGGAMGVIPAGTPYDPSYAAFGTNSTRAVGLGDNAMGMKLQRACTLTSVTYRVATADASGNLVVELRKNGTTISGTSATIAAANQVAGGTVTGSWSFAAGDILTVYVTAIGTTPGKGLVMDALGVVV